MLIICIKYKHQHLASWQEITQPWIWHTVETQEKAGPLLQQSVLPPTELSSECSSLCKKIAWNF